MICTCPQCRDFYADDTLLFCLADGTPLVRVEPHDELWREGQRVVEEKENTRRKKERGRKWRRVVLASMTMMIVAAVIFVVTVNGVIYLKPQTEEKSARAEAPTPGTPDSPDTSFIPAPQRQPDGWARPTPTPSPTPEVVIKPTPTPTPRSILSATPTPTPTPMIDATPPDGAATATCTEADKRRETEAIAKSYGQTWRQRIMSEEEQEFTQGVKPTLSALDYTSSFFKECQAGVITVRYSWSVRANDKETDRAIPKERKFSCRKIGGVWLCR